VNGRGGGHGEHGLGLARLPRVAGRVLEPSCPSPPSTLPWCTCSRSRCRRVSTSAFCFSARARASTHAHATYTQSRSQFCLGWQHPLSVSVAMRVARRSVTKGQQVDAVDTVDAGSHRSLTTNNSGAIESVLLNYYRVQTRSVPVARMRASSARTR
jgi:hypothetical protein